MRSGSNAASILSDAPQGRPPPRANPGLPIDAPCCGAWCRTTSARAVPRPVSVFCAKTWCRVPFPEMDTYPFSVTKRAKLMMTATYSVTLGPSKDAVAGKNWHGILFLGLGYLTVFSGRGKIGANRNGCADPRGKSRVARNFCFWARGKSRLAGNFCRSGRGKSRFGRNFCFWARGKSRVARNFCRGGPGKSRVAGNFCRGGRGTSRVARNFCRSGLGRQRCDENQHRGRRHGVARPEQCRAPLSLDPGTWDRHFRRMNLRLNSRVPWDQA